MATANLVEIERAALRLRTASLRLSALNDDESRKAVAEARAAYERLAKAAPEGSARPPTADAHGAPPGRGQRMGADTTGLEAKVSIRMENLPTSMAHVLARNGAPLVSVSVTNANKQDGARVAVRCWVEGYSAHAVASREIAWRKSETFDLFPPLFPGQVRGLTEMAVASLHVEVRDLDSEKLEAVASYPIALLPPTTAVLAQVDPSTGREVDHTPLLTAWVTPNAPEVLAFLRTCADCSKLKAMLGYQIDADGIREHVRAIYDALKAASIVYVHSPVAFGASANQFIQRVRLPRESLSQRSANCIDGTVLMASLLEATGLDPAIVLIPGHAYLGYRPEEGGTTWEYVETTLIGTETFDRAREVAEAKTRSAAAAGEVTVLDVAAGRKRGITPIE
ncbi:MAG TPA: hypothetical protein VFS43_44195 [Polyangiaceae bacterium]|nr:hypothetical protein [Polyangiaceae bacterium]